VQLKNKIMKNLVEINILLFALKERLKMLSFNEKLDLDIELMIIEDIEYVITEEQILKL